MAIKIGYFFSKKITFKTLTGQILSEKHILSKSTFLRGLQCGKSLYLYKNFIQLRDAPSAEQQAIFNRGNNVGILAQKIFPGGIDATPKKRSDNLEAVRRTKELIEQGAEIIYEAAFQHEQVLAILDILVKKEGTWHAYEVKSSVKISQTYILDASLQYWVITGSGLPLTDISLITLNNKYVKKGELDVPKLFSITSVLKDALKNQEMISEKVIVSKTVAADPKMPEVTIGEHCFSPYSCDFMGTCWKQVPKNSVFEITGMSKSDQFALYRKGYQTVSDIPDENELDQNTNLHIQAVKKGEATTQKKELQGFVAKAVYPLFFMDFETFMPAIPLFDGTKPYQHIPFQFSLHYKMAPDAPLQHTEFLAEQGIDPRKSFIETILKHTRTPGTILVYDALMEKNMLNAMKNDFPEHAKEIDERLSRFLDLMIPFQEKLYYHPAMKNSFSIKNVLPALVPELNFQGMKISSGSIAMIAFEHLQKETDMFRILELREQLLEYCKMDTLAMARVFDVIEKAASEKEA